MRKFFSTLIIALCLSYSYSQKASIANDEAGSYFSPNGDGVNDEYRFTFVNMDTVDVKVFDEKNSIIYTQKEFDGNWKGDDLKGKSVKEGLYFYEITAIGIDGKTYNKKGKINLTRSANH